MKKIMLYAIVSILVYSTAYSQIKYNDTNLMLDTKMGVERVARFFTPAYESTVAQSDNELRWIQIDLGQERKIEAVKLLPRIHIWDSPTSIGFPAHFKIEVSNDADFKTSILYEDRIKKYAIPDPVDAVVTFDTKEVNGRYIRLTAIELRQKKLAMSKIMVISGGKDVAEGCTATESQPDSTSNIELLTRHQRPQGEGVVTNNPDNIIPQKDWKPVTYKAEKPISGVKLSEGLFKKAMDYNISYLLGTVTTDELVRNFRIKAGLPVQAFNEKLSKFWYQDLPGQEAGHFLMGAGNTLRWVENEKLRAEMNKIVDVIDECKEPDGYILAYPKNNIFHLENGAYARSWLTHGLIEAGYAGNQKAFSLLRGFYDWFDTCYYLPELLRRAGHGTQGIIPMTRAYFTPIGKPKEIEVVQQYFQENYWIDRLTNRDPNVIWLYPYDKPTNYLITAIEPYLDLYRATGAKKYLDASIGGWDLFHDNWEHVGGSIAITEGAFLFPPKSYYLRHHTGELCGSVFWSFLNQRFHLLYPDEEKYVTEIEKTIYNVLLANQYESKGIAYHADLIDLKDFDVFPPKLMTWCSRTCCEGQGTRMIGSLPEFIYSLAEDGVYVNLYSASSISFKANQEEVKMKMTTDFPYNPKVQIDISCSKPTQAKVRIRIPSWAAKSMPVVVNGKGMATSNPGSYLTLDRVWKNGDVISFGLPIDFKLSRYNGMEKGYGENNYALEYGPILMAIVDSKQQKDGIKVTISPENFKKQIKLIPDKPLHFSVSGDQSLEYWPYFEIKEEAFTCYPELLKAK